MSGSDAVRFEPKIVGFLCHWCAYAGADKAGADQKPFAPNVRAIRVQCSGGVDPELVLAAFERGADGVLILACHPGDCHYKEQNYRAIQRHQILLRLMEQAGIDGRRCRLDFVSASSGGRFVEIVEDMVEGVRRLGPLARGGGRPSPREQANAEG